LGPAVGVAVLLETVRSGFFVVTAFGFFEVAEAPAPFSLPVFLVFIPFPVDPVQFFQLSTIIFHLVGYRV